MRVNNVTIARVLSVGALTLLFIACGGKEYRSTSSSEDHRRQYKADEHALDYSSATDSAAVTSSTTSAPSTSDEEYNTIFENDFLAARSNPLSTFSIDVDAAAYSNVRRHLDDGMLPPPDAVRIEELINYFTYDYPQPSGDHPFSVTTELSRCPWNPEHKLVQIGVQGKKITTGNLPPNNLVFLIDVSGSMDEPDKLPLLKESFAQLVERLRPEDRVAIVVYAGSSGLVLPSTPGSEKEEILDAIDDLDAGGSTAGGDGINLAYRIARENYLRNGNNRVILATDGDFNVGVSSEAELVSLIEQKRNDGVFLTVLGFGSGNLKDSRMEQLADKGNGHYAYIDGVDEARKVFVDEMAGTLFAIAKDVKIQVEFNPALVSAYRLVGYENRSLAAEDFNDDQKDAGELGAGHSVTALYEVIPAKASAGRPRVDRLKYQPTAGHEELYGSEEIMTVKLRYKHPKGEESRLIAKPVIDSDNAIYSASNNLKFAAAVAEWGMLLRDSKYKGNSSFTEVLKLAMDAKGSDDRKLRSEFISLVLKSRGLKEGAM